MENGKLSLEQVVLGILSFSMESENHLPSFCLYEKQIHVKQLLRIHFSYVNILTLLFCSTYQE